ncbi:hypothetical protein PHYBLDRAFT_180249 [Phycomyces blakesleeanus NRRL 1555(-)]|uniref:Uncharacterized protein n=1 Tax=Phycomyces blakesleeanus (strain ATCC 8743b / DSM 1359 / FGSC 10004 / NBRC 33097 / NRRL 1555) TaxID=763407 RepID=A0A162XWT6_PHYB8|nr:hypothetical protein PHYBLDRAFT_180249 [Phycomyces blakesleeanus NRRL 1555(-)]OAD76945.1 hypothetical protein PHYBLDRAFT_180249 [Phycomyces blakesleeanus NRRL 1555(-)]|eukprot:XP_018294985.1 hypothetical protein PHYBLDRAFT_180249 [Phycomyces blakesleeanus NRRL 1555(-)]
MERSLMDYDNSLEELERQREQLEIVMKRMGEEWEESGAGIGWLGSLPSGPELPGLGQEQGLSSSPQSSLVAAVKAAVSATSPTTTIITEKTGLAETLDNPTPILPTFEDGVFSLALAPSPLFSNILSQDTGPTPEYLQTLLNVNDALLAQSCLNAQNSSDLPDPTSMMPNRISKAMTMTPVLQEYDSNNDMSSSSTSSSGPVTPEEQSTSNQKIPLHFP